MRAVEPGGPESWCLRIHPERADHVRGAGFLIAPDLALTCAGFVTGDDQVHVRTAGPGGTEHRGRVMEVLPDADLAVLHLPDLAERIPPAPLAPPGPVLPGTALMAYGYPAESAESAGHGEGENDGRGAREESDRHGAWTPLVARGGDMSGTCVRADVQGPDAAPLHPGFRGGPVVDLGNGRVVGMSRSVEAAHGVVWFLPLTAIAAHWPRLRSYLPDPLDIDPDYRRGRAALADGDYLGADRALAAAARRHPRAPVHYRLALARLARRSPRTLRAEQLADIESLVRRALCANPAYAPAAALLAVLKEEAHRPPDPPDEPPYLTELHARAVHCGREELTELRTHCPAAAGSVTWYLLIGRKERAS